MMPVEIAIPGPPVSKARPRVFQRDYLDVNTLGTVPFFVDGDVQMTESCAIPQYLVDRYERYLAWYDKWVKGENDDGDQQE